MSQGYKLDSLDLVCGKTQFFYLKGTLEAESHILVNYAVISRPFGPQSTEHEHNER